MKAGAALEVLDLSDNGIEGVVGLLERKHATLKDLRINNEMDVEKYY